MNSNENIINLPEKFPRFLYKFRYFDDKGHHLRILTHNEIFFSSPSQFNDPFDCHIPIRYDLGTKYQVIEKLKNFIITQHLKTSEKDARREAKKLYKTKRHKDRNIVKQQTDQFNDESFGIFCLTANYSNILNWSHYADSHKGFCIGFDSSILLQICVNVIKELNKYLILQKVTYCNELPIINPYAINYTDIIIEDGLLTKSKEWEYEKEFRMIFQEKPNAKLNLPDNAIRRVIIGCQTSQSNKDKLHSIIRERKNKVSVFQSVESQDEFKLHFKGMRI